MKSPIMPADCPVEIVFALQEFAQETDDITVGAWLPTIYHVIRCALIKRETEELIERKKPSCLRCRDAGCPACDGTKGSKYNPEPY